MPKYPQDCGPLITIDTAFTLLGASNIKDSSNATSVRVLDCQHLASSKLAPSLDVKTFTSLGAYAQSTFKPSATRREFKTPVQVTPWTAKRCEIKITRSPRSAMRGVAARSAPTSLMALTCAASQPRALPRCLTAAGAPVGTSRCANERGAKELQAKLAPIARSTGERLLCSKSWRTCQIAC